jgi:hypothetical protein
LIILVFVALGVLYHGKIQLPPNTLPWRPVDLNAPPAWIAHWQLNRLGDDKPACRVAISHTALRYTPMADRRIENACGFTNVVRADASPIGFAPHVTATCGLTAALYWFQRGAAAHRCIVPRPPCHARLCRCLGPDCGAGRFLQRWRPPLDPGLPDPRSRGAVGWSLWQAEIDLPEGEHELSVRAWDSAGQTQPERPDDTWNFKGYLSAGVGY